MNNQIKAACLPDPLVALAESKGAKLIVDDTNVNLSQTVIYFHNDFLENQGQSVTKFLRAYAMAAKDINDNSKQYRDLLVEKANVPQEAMDVFKTDQYPEPQLPQKIQVEKVVRWMLEKGLLKQLLHFKEMVRADLLTAN